MKYIKLFESQSKSYDIWDAAWIYLIYLYNNKFDGFKYDSWKNDSRMNGRKMTETMDTLDLNVVDGIVKLNQKSLNILEEFFGSKSIEEASKRNFEIGEKYGIFNGRDNYPIHRLPLELYLYKNPKLEDQFDKIGDIITNHYNSQICNSKYAQKLSKMRGIKEFNKMNFILKYGSLDNKIKVYRGIKRSYTESTDGFSCWTNDKEQGVRFAKYNFTGYMQFSPDYTVSPTLLETEISFDDISVFISGDESEILLKNPVKNIKVTDLRYVECDKCDHSWTFNDNIGDNFWQKDKDPYLCHKCGYDNDLKKYDMDKLEEWKKENPDKIIESFDSFINRKERIKFDLNDPNIFEPNISDEEYKSDVISSK